MNTPIACEALVGRLAAAVPALRPVLDEHLAYYEEMLSHVFFGDVTRFVMDSIVRDSDHSPARAGALRVIAFLEAELTDPHPDVKNLISVSFLENVDWETPAGAAIRAALGPNLTDEQTRRENWPSPAPRRWWQWFRR